MAIERPSAKKLWDDIWMRHVGGNPGVAVYDIFERMNAGKFKEAQDDESGRRPMLTNFALAFLKDRHLLETFGARMEDKVFVLMFVFACQPWPYGNIKPQVELFRLLGRVFPETPSGTVAS